MRDLFDEIYNSIRNNKLRTALTGFAVSWGIFLLIALLGAGNGLMNSFSGNQERYIRDGIKVEGWVTSKPYAGYKEDRLIYLDQQDLDYTKGKQWDGIIDNIAIETERKSVILELNGNTINANLCGVTRQYKDQNKKVMVAGRFINEEDLREHRKALILSTSQARQLVDSGDPNSILGRWIICNSIPFQVVGLFHAKDDEYIPICPIPYTTYKTLYDPSDKIETFTFTVKGINSITQHKAFEESYLSTLKVHHNVAPDDNRAFWVDNGYTDNIEIKKASSILTLAMWILGILTLISGIVGVSNIMLITVKERTHEFGIRKAIGAKPGSILTLIMTESIAITSFFGYLGMLLGMIVCEILEKTIGQNTVDTGFEQLQLLVNPYVDIHSAMGATLLLIVAGTLAGIVPAWKAAKVKPIEALRAE